MADEKMLFVVYDAGNDVCVCNIPAQDLKIGDEIEVDFTSPLVEWVGGSWGKQEGTFIFKVHGFGRYDHDHSDKTPYCELMYGMDEDEHEDAKANIK